jgi:hypothetical protein
MSKPTAGHCTICEKYFTLLHWHHTVPQAVGGKDSLQIPLCSQCHNVLHAHANSILASIRTGRRTKRTFWQNNIEQLNAKPYVQIIVESVQAYEESLPGGKEWMFSARIPDKLYKALRLYKNDTTGLKSIEQALLVCLSEALKSKGYYETDNTLSEASEIQVKKPSTPLW